MTYDSDFRIPIGEPIVESILIAFLNKEDWSLRWRAGEALGQLKDFGAVEPFLQVSRDKGES